MYIIYVPWGSFQIIVQITLNTERGRDQDEQMGSGRRISLYSKLEPSIPLDV
jgi:hypothetical protein